MNLLRYQAVPASGISLVEELLFLLLILMEVTNSRHEMNRCHSVRRALVISTDRPLSVLVHWPDCPQRWPRRRSAACLWSESGQDKHTNLRFMLPAEIAVSNLLGLKRIQLPNRVSTMKYIDDHMPYWTPPCERIPLYITSFQSSPVRICRKPRATWRLFRLRLLKVNICQKTSEDTLRKERQRHL